MSEYEKLGVSAHKKEVHQAIRQLPPSDIPYTFARIILQKGRAHALHLDTAGTKPALAYLYWKETGTLAAWQWVAQDAIVMNIDDLAVTGFTGPFMIASNIARNKHCIPAEVIQTIISENQRYCQWLTNKGFPCRVAGGETADVGDIVRTIDVGITAYADAPPESVKAVRIQPGDVIIGIASEGDFDGPDGPHYNSGIGCNGLTLARHAVLRAEYGQKYPETVAPETPKSSAYRGRRLLTDTLETPAGSRTVAELLLAPTATYLPVLAPLSHHLKKYIHGMIHCTGGGQTKVMHFLQKVRVVKDNLFPVPKVFQMIQQEGNIPWKEMYRVFNMGHRLEIYIAPEKADEAIRIIQDSGYRAQKIGYCQPAHRPEVEVHVPNTDQNPIYYAYNS